MIVSCAKCGQSHARSRRTRGWLCPGCRSQPVGMQRLRDKMGPEGLAALHQVFDDALAELETRTNAGTQQTRPEERQRESS